MSGGFSAVGEGAAMASLAGAAARFNIGLSAAANMAGQLIVRRVQTGMAASSVPSAPHKCAVKASPVLTSRTGSPSASTP